MSGRREDHRLLSGAGRYVADLSEEGMVHGAVHRSSYAHAEIEHIDIERARSMPGVLAIFTARDLAADGIDHLPCGVELLRPNGEKAFQARRRILADDRVRFVGEPVAFVVAETLGEAMDASDLIDVHYKELPVVASLDEAVGGSSKTVWAEVPDNVAFVWERGDREKAEAALSTAAHKIRFEDHISRVTAAPIEPRGCLGFVDPQGRLTLKIANQSPFALANALAGQFGVARDQVRIVAGDLGGSFGMKSGAYPEDVLVLWAAQKVGKPVKWIAERREDLLADDHGRDIRFTSELAVDEEGLFLGLKVQLEIDLGCYLSGRSLVCLGNIGGISGVYKIPAVSADARGIFTNKHMTAPYRGAGRPEATYIIERTIDTAARELNIDPFELRSRNLIPSASMPFDTGFLFNYDCGDFAANMSTASRLSQYDTFPERQAKAKENGRLRGIGLSNPIEVAGGPFVKPMGDHAALALQSDGTWELKPGAMSTGQGLETAFSDLVAERLGLRPEQITYRQGDSDLLPGGRGSGGSSSTPVGGGAVVTAVEKFVASAKKLAAEKLDSAESEIEFEDGLFKLKDSNETVDWDDIQNLVRESGQDSLSVSAEFHPSAVTFPNGCHVCEVEIDPATGELEIVNYTVVEDVGNVLNETFVKAQIHGGIAQGVGQALGEELVYEDGGQLVTGTFMDYPMPRAGDLCNITVACQSVPTAVNPLGAKGVGEAGTVGSLAAAMNAVCNALGPVGVKKLEMPATAARIWDAIRDSQHVD